MFEREDIIERRTYLAAGERTPNGLLQQSQGGGKGGELEFKIDRFTGRNLKVVAT